MTPARHRGTPQQARARFATRGHIVTGGAHRERPEPTQVPGATGLTTAPLHHGKAAEALAQLQAHQLWERYGGSTYALARALLGDDLAAAKAVQLGMGDVSATEVGAPPHVVRRTLARHVYERSQELQADTSWTVHLPASMVQLGQLAQLQRACLALCLFGGHTHREAAALIGVPAPTVARSLTSGLRDLGFLSAGGPAAATG